MTSTGAEDEDQTVDDQVVLDYQTETPAEDAQRAWRPMKVDGHVVRVRRPKSAFFVHIAKMETGTDQEKVRSVDTILDRVFDDDSQAYLRDRLDDDDDDFDIEDVGKIMQRLQEVWAPGRPTGSSRGSARRSGNPSRRSTARSR